MRLTRIRRCLCIRPRKYGPIALQRRGLWGGIPLIRVPPRVQNQQIPSDSSSPCRKIPEYKKLTDLENFLTIRIFEPLGPPRGK
jgi:hypothetical protein